MRLLFDKTKKLDSLKSVRKKASALPELEVLSNQFLVDRRTGSEACRTRFALDRFIFSYLKSRFRREECIEECREFNERRVRC